MELLGAARRLRPCRWAGPDRAGPGSSLSRSSGIGERLSRARPLARGRCPSGGPQRTRVPRRGPRPGRSLADCGCGPEPGGAQRPAPKPLWSSWDATGGLSTAHVGSVGPRWTAGGPGNEHTGPDDSLARDGRRDPTAAPVGTLGEDGLRNNGGDSRRARLPPSVVLGVAGGVPVTPPEATGT
ncbi:hypothetical protein NDU88_002796 [Pleurodeles waltl]|uniref:Uncharacterized protein n=1 Tax=Pleurodeles waltl TaxID=8319 RepID=A0AAV7RGE0_PLEWA|nr:hypothetical protein NDU88_002796 [Pleurodeles waltl]